MYVCKCKLYLRLYNMIKNQPGSHFQILSHSVYIYSAHNKGWKIHKFKIALLWTIIGDVQ